MGRYSLLNRPHSGGGVEYDLFDGLVVTDSFDQHNETVRKCLEFICLYLSVCFVNCRN